MFEIEPGFWIPIDSVPSIEEINKRKERLVRPKLNLLRIVVNILLFLIVLFAPIIFFKFVDLPLNSWQKSLICISIVLAYTILRLKSLAIFLIILYQKFAPMRIRERCNMEPTCSTYSILAIKKYGLMKGIKKGVGRLKRCGKQEIHVDYP